jgi:hypothetical protein
MNNSEHEESFADGVTSEEDLESVNDGRSAEAKGLPNRKRARRKLLTVLAMIGVVLLVVFAGGWVWHEQPGFCSAICHQPMDSYVEGFYSGDPALLVTGHEEAGERCLTCHAPTIGEQIAEVGTWISGAYSDPLPMTKTGTREFCLECHDSEEIKSATVAYGGSARNPHDSHYGDQLECFTCHRVHRPSVMYCSECHQDIVAPETWEDVR